MKNILRCIIKLPFLAYLRLHQKSFRGVKYLRFNRKSKVLAIVFSAFDPENDKRAYNYVKSLSRIPIDFLFLSDPWGFRGSYYLCHKGCSEPQEITQQLALQAISRGYSRVVTLGTSKGGTAALFYGLKCHATDVITGACQYRIGSYISEYPDIFKGMTANDINENDIDNLDAVMPQILSSNRGSHISINLVHSINEPTYQRDIKYLISDLNSYGYDWSEFECGFEKHADVGKYFIPIAKKILTEIKKDSL